MKDILVAYKQGNAAISRVMEEVETTDGKMEASIPPKSSDGCLLKRM